MILYTVFQFTLLFELLFFLLWAFPSWANQSSQVTSETKQSNPSNVSNSSSCDIQEQCGVCDLTTDGGTIKIPDNPDDRPGLNCLITVRAPSSAKIELTFTQFAVDQCWDFVTVFDGARDPFELRLTEHAIPKAITSSSSEIKVKFKTNNNNNNNALGPSQWQAKFKFLYNETLVNTSQLDMTRNETDTSVLAPTDITI